MGSKLFKILVQQLNTIEINGFYQSLGQPEDHFINRENGRAHCLRKKNKNSKKSTGGFQCISVHIQGVNQILCFFSENFEIYSGLWPLSVYPRCVHFMLGPLNGR